jgi:hypothetical protein
VLTVLCSWDSGANAITQAVKLAKGTYRLLLDMRYECPNETSNNGKVVTTSGNNNNTSLTGVKIGTKTDYRYPSERNTWQQLCYDFTLTTDQTVTLSLGFQASASVGAANNTLLYIDHIRLLASEENETVGIREVGQVQEQDVIYDLQGRRTEHPRSGLYVQNKKKVILTK